MSQQINLFNQAFRKRGASLASAMTLLYIVIASVALAIAGVAFAAYRVSVVQKQAAAVEADDRTWTQRRDALVAMQAAHRPDAQLQAQIDDLQTQLDTKREVIALLDSGAVGTTDGFSEYMRAFARQSVSGLWLTGFDIGTANNKLVITGRTLSPDLLPNYLQRLNREKILQGRAFATLDIGQPVVPQQDASKNAASMPARFLEFKIATEDADAGKTGGAQ